MKNANNKLFLFLASCLFIIPFTLLATDVPSGLIDAVKNGNAQQLSSFFNDPVIMSVQSFEGSFSKNQAQQIMRDFFQKNSPASVQVIHQGGREDNKFAIFEYISGQSKFRITIYLKFENDKSLIYNILIQNDNNQ